MLTREIYWNIVGESLIYGGLVLALAVAAAGVVRRVRLWRLGTAASRSDRMGQRLLGLGIELLGQRRTMRDPVAGHIHLLIFYGFLAELVATGLIAVQEWSGIHFLQGPFYLGYSLLADSFGILAITGLGLAMWRRAVVRPARLHTLLDDWIFLILLLLIFVQGFLIEGMRIAATELQARPELAPWSPGGYVVALALQDLPPALLREFHRGLWWVHALTVFGFIAYLGFGKLGHVLYGAGNILLRNLDSSGKLDFPDIDELAESDPDALESLGVGTIEQFPWKRLMDLDACVNCGRCEDVCPAHGSGVALNPRQLIQDLKAHLSETGPERLRRRRAQAQGLDPGAAPDAPLIGPVKDTTPVPAVLEEEIWGCRTCGACQQECPMFIEHIPTIVDMRRHLVMTESRMGEEAQQFLKNMDDRMHPWVGAAHDREEWFQDLDIKLFGRGDSAEYLFWVGCTGAMVDRNIQVTRAMVKILKAAGVDFALLGAEEACSGDPARRVGGELTFQFCAKQNIETLSRYGVHKVITTCPHCFNTLRNEYPEYGGNYEVIHHSELIRDLIHAGRLPLHGKLESLTYHDPCYLGRHNGVYDAPREVLGTLTPENDFQELPRNRSRALCCGAGGGYAWMDDSPEKRISHSRVEEIQACGAKTTAVSCPFCMQMLSDALGSLDPDHRVRAADIAELVAEALDPPASAA